MPDARLPTRGRSPHVHGRPARTLEQVAQAAGRRTDEIEQLRRLPRDLVDDLVATGVFRTWVPQRYGGAGGDVAALLDAIETVDYHDGATGCCVMIGGAGSSRSLAERPVVQAGLAGAEADVRSALAEPSSLTPSSSRDVDHGNTGGRGGEPLEIHEINRCDQAPTGEVCGGHEKRVDRQLGSGARSFEELPRTNPRRTADVVKLHTFAPQDGEHRSVGRPPPQDLGEHGCRGADRSVQVPHPLHQCTDPVPPSDRTVRDRRERLAVEQQHQLARAASSTVDTQLVTTPSAHARSSAGTGPYARSISCSHSSSAARCRT